MPDKPFHNPFAALEHLRGRLPAPEPAAVPVAAPPATASVRRAVVRLERSGRGGKEVTVVEHLGLPGSEQDAWLRSLRSALGCGGTVEGDAIVLQGDHRKRLPALLTARGVKRVTLGS